MLEYLQIQINEWGSEWIFPFLLQEVLSLKIGVDVVIAVSSQSLADIALN